MSEAVLIYQVLIFATILAAGVLIGPKPLALTAIGWCIWTVVLVFTGWLFILQFATIAVSYGAVETIRESPNFPRIQGNARKSSAWLAMVGCLLIGFLIYDYVTKKRTAPSQSVTSPPSAPSVASAPNFNAQSDDLDLAYFNVLRSVESKHPVLNPDLPGFRQDLVNEVLRRMNEYKQRGNSSAQALQNAVRDMERESATTSAPTPVAMTPRPLSTRAPQQDGVSDIDRTCHYKSVMSDQDYKNCGLQPPVTN